MSQAGVFSAGGGGGGPITSVHTDAGTATPVAGVLNIITDVAAINCGSSVEFTGSGNTVELHVTDSLTNTFIGKGTGSSGMTGIDNTSLGAFNCLSLTTGFVNCVIGTSCLESLTTGSYNFILGSVSGNNYTGSESSNILIGANLNGVNGESNTLRIGNFTGTGNGSLSRAFICGIDAVDLSTVNIVTESSNQLGTASLTSGTGISISTGANEIIISATGGGGANSFVTDNGTATQSAGTINIIANTASLNAGSSVSFSGSGDTVQLNVTDSLDNIMIGLSSGNAGITGRRNVGLGYLCGTSANSGNDNIMLGYQTGASMTSGHANIMIGSNAGFTLDGALGGANGNTLIGFTAGFSLQSGTTNVIIGFNAGVNLVDGINNVFLGANAGISSVNDDDNFILGTNSGTVLNGGTKNVFLGSSSATSLTTGDHNTFIGALTASTLLSASNNIGIGYQAADAYASSESDNILIGSVGVVGESNALHIGDGTGSGTKQLNQAFISGIRGITPATADGIPVFIGSTGQLGTVGSGGSSLLSTLTGDTGGALSPTSGNINILGGSTGLSFGGSGSTLTTTFAGITANGGTVSLATDATTSTVNIGTGAGAKTVTLGSTNSSSSLALDYGTGNLTVASGSGTVVSALAAGEVTMPLQPAFLASLATSVANVTGDATVYTLVYDTVVYDQASNFSTSTFTAPVTGIYHFCVSIALSNIGASNAQSGYMQLITTKNTFTLFQGSFNSLKSTVVSPTNEVVIGNNCYANMSSGDTATVVVSASGGVPGKTISVLGSSTAGSLVNFFSGVLVV